jgi:hypothetical protein
MTVPSRLVRDHIDAALTRHDWDAVESSVSEDVRLKMTGIEDWVWTISSLYRHISQAWDFTPEDVQLGDRADGSVGADIRLSNGDGWVKRVVGDYHVLGDRIDFIALTDDVPVKAHRDLR